MYKRIENEWIKHLDFMLLDLLGFLAAFRLSYSFLCWYDVSLNKPFYSSQVCVLFIMQVAVSLIMQPYSHILRRSDDVELLNVIKTSAVIMMIDIIRSI